MARALLDAVCKAVRCYGLLDSGDTVLVALSGGADSVALLAALRELRDVLGVALVAAHLDHGLRGAESAADRVFVERLASELAVPLHVETAEIPSGNLEAQARRVRYAFLERAAKAFGATKIATAHTLDDQAETVLLHLLRGAGRRGLGGIRPRRGRIIRPLIRCDRIQVRWFLVERGLQWCRDRSNFDFTYARSRIRAGYLPALAREFNPRLARALARLADVQREEDALLDRLAATVPGTGEVLGLSMLRSIEAPLARRVVRRWWRHYGSGRRLGWTHVEAALALAHRAAGGGGVRVPGGAIVREDSALRFRTATEVPDAHEAYAFTLTPGVALELSGGWRLRMFESRAGEGPAPGDAVCVIDADRVQAPLSVRNRRRGDCVRPIGMGGQTTIKRLFIARRVPRGLRASHPLVLAGEEVLWVPGCARSERALVTDTTRRTLVICVETAPRKARTPQP
jgi:tRNA(Ile)-lysidine synthase